MNYDPIQAVCDSLAQAGYTGLKVHQLHGMTTMTGPLPGDAETLEQILGQNHWPASSELSPEAD
jgi:hypothetical protein